MSNLVNCELYQSLYHVHCCKLWEILIIFISTVGYVNTGRPVLCVVQGTGDYSGRACGGNERQLTQQQLVGECFLKPLPASDCSVVMLHWSPAGNDSRHLGSLMTTCAVRPHCYHSIEISCECTEGFIIYQILLHVPLWWQRLRLRYTLPVIQSAGWMWD